MTDLGPAGASPLDRFEQHLIAGGELLRQSRLADAQRELLAALELTPDSAKALALLGLAYFRGGRFQEALPVYRRLVASTPGDASYHLNLGLVLLKLGDATGAATALERSRDLDPSQGRAVSYLGLAYARGGRFPEAYQAFLLAGQADLAREVAENLLPEERTAIEQTLRRRAAQNAAAEAAAAAPTEAPASESSRFVQRGLWEQPEEGDEDVDALDHPVIVVETPSSIDALAVARAEARNQALQSAPPAPAPAASAPAPAPDAASALDQSDDDSAFDLLASQPSDPAIAVPPAAPEEPRPTIEPRRTGPRPPSVPPFAAPRPAPRPEPARAAEPDDDLEPLDGVVADVARGAISRALAEAAPAAHTSARVAAGNRPPQPLSEFATTRLVRLEDGDEPFEISASGVLIVRVADKMFSRTEGVDVSGGQLTYEPALRRSRGQNRAEPFATGGRQMFAVTGQGHLIAAALGGQFTAVSLDDDIFYLREDLVFAFEPSLRWENGHVPGSRERIPMVQFRGSGAVAFRTARPLLSVKLAQERVLYVDATALAGWIGRVVPRAVSPADGGPGSELFVECTGEGVVLVEEEQAPARPAS